MNIVEQEATSLIQMSVGPLAKCVNESRVSKRADLTQTHIDMCWAIIKPIVEKIPPQRYRELIKDITAAQNLLDGVRNQTRWPHSLKISNWNKAQKAERQADIALRNARATSSQVELEEVQKRRKEMAQRQSEEAQLRKDEEAKRLAEEYNKLVDAEVQKRLAETERRRGDAEKEKASQNKERKRQADKAKKQKRIIDEKRRAEAEKKCRKQTSNGRGDQNIRSAKYISAEDVDPCAVEGYSNQELLRACDALQVDASEMMGIVVKIFNRKAAGILVDKRYFEEIIRAVINEKTSPSTALAPDAVDELVAVMTQSLSLVIRAGSSSI